MQLTEQNLELTWARFKKTRDKEDRNLLAGHYFSYVIRIAKRMASKMRYKITESELSSYGVHGLYKSLDGFDDSRGVKFETYAYRKIQGSMLDGMRADDWVPRSVRIKYSKKEKKREKLEQEFGRRVTEDEILSVLDIDENEYNKNSHHYNPSYVVSIDCASGLGIESEDVDLACNDKLASSGSSSDSSLLRKEFLSKLIGKNFTRTEQRIVYFYYYRNLTMKEISLELKMSESRVSQIHHDMIPRLKKRIWVNPKYFDNEILSSISTCKDKGSLFK